MKRAAVLVLLAACEDVPQPFELDHARVMAVRIEPPTLAPGETARIDALVTDATDGPRVVAPTTVSGPGVARDDQGWTVTAGDTAGLGALTLTVTTDEGELPAQKTFAVGARVENPPVPVIEGMMAPFPARDAMLSPTTIEDGMSYRWFSSVGDLTGYTRAEVELSPDRGRAGFIVLVVRDQQGGVAWTLETAEVSP